MILNKRYLSALPLFVFCFWLIDLGNIEAIRQGTEGFYLQVSKEVYQVKSWLVPIYLKNRHWSKPPLHFWLPQPFFLISGAASLFLSRLAIVISTILLTLCIDKWAQKFLGFQKYLLFFVLVASVGFLKYGRIYMMEMPLSLLTALSSLYFFQYLEFKRSRDFLVLILCTASANLIKGPVSFVMNFGAVFFYLAYEYIHKKKLIVRPYLIWIVASVILGSIWYLTCYIQYGNEFIDYFFLRENLGKFQSKSYPISSVINGLLVFSLPWTLLLPIFFNKTLLQNLWKEKVNRFIIFHFVFLFLLWMIPSQRSHHYAMPAQPFFLILITIVLINLRKNLNQVWLKNLFKTIPCLLLFFAGLLSSSLIFEEIRSHAIFLLRIISGIIIILTGAIYLLRSRTGLYKTAIISFISFGYIWIIFAPTFYLPTVPQNVVNKAKSQQVSVIYHKPYFLSELLGTEVRVLNQSLIQADVNSPKKFYIMSQKDFNRFGFKSFLRIQKIWPVWIRGSKLKNIMHAFSAKSLKGLQENMVLLVPLSPSS
jgi:4-amino-4-deoxy-L-arabinose transferase-like glycosyltransferase